jgi:hypothetical protein
MDKEFWKSKTFYFGLLWIGVGVAGLFGYFDFSPGSDVIEWAEIINGLIVIGLRIVTKVPVKFLG